MYKPAIPFLGIYMGEKKKSEYTTLKRNIHLIVHSSTIYNSQDMEATPKAPTN